MEEKNTSLSDVTKTQPIGTSPTDRASFAYAIHHSAQKNSLFFSYQNCAKNCQVSLTLTKAFVIN
jgi:hypothetical protein